MISKVNREKWREFVSDFVSNKVAVTALLALVLLIAAALFAPLIAPFDPYDLTQLRLVNSAKPPLSREEIGERESYSLTLRMGERSAKRKGELSAELEWETQTNGKVHVKVRTSLPVGGKAVITGLPQGASVVGASKHPVKNQWTLLLGEQTNTIDVIFERASGLRSFTLALTSPRHYSGKRFLLGSDRYGRDMFSAILYGMRVSLYIGLVSGAIALAIGVFIGLFTAWKGGKIDILLMRIVDLQQSFPAVLIGILVVAILGKGLQQMILTLIIVQWSFYVRTVRSVVLVEKGKDYISMCRGLGLPNRRILLSHLLPNCVPQIIVLATTRIAAAITLESTLSFLGLGLTPTKPSLGLLIAQGYEFMLSGKFWISLYAGLALLFLIMSINLVGEHLRVLTLPHGRR